MYLKMNYGGEFDQKFTSQPNSVASARELARNQGRRGTVTGIPQSESTKVKIITGFDATIVEDRSGENGTSNSVPSSSSRIEINEGDDGAADDDNDYDLVDDECGDERQELQQLPLSLLLKRNFWS